MMIIIVSLLLDCLAFISRGTSLLSYYALCIATTIQYQQAIPSTNIIVMQQLSARSYSPLTSPNQSPSQSLGKICAHGREQTAEYQSVPGAAFKKPYSV